MFLLLFLLSFEAFGFPANARIGYGNCGTCHHSPTGGGVLTEYGASTASEISSFVFSENEDVTKKYPIFLGGDFRYLYIHSKSRELSFPMQADMELGFDLYGFKAVGQLGIYSEDMNISSYRAYMMYTSGLHSIRFGHFAPAFGINEPDHYLPGRNSMGFDTRNASMNLEYNYAGKKYSLNLTGIAGGQGAFYDPKSTGMYMSSGKWGGTLQATVFPVKGVWASLSGAFLYDVDTKEVESPKGALSLILGNKDIYTKTEYAIEYDIKKLKLLQQGWSELNFVPLPGVHYGFTLKIRNDSFSYGNQIVWYPFSGLEIQGLIEREISEFDDSAKFLGIMHLYF